MLSKREKSCNAGATVTATRAMAQKRDAEQLLPNDDAAAVENDSERTPKRACMDHDVTVEAATTFHAGEPEGSSVQQATEACNEENPGQPGVTAEMSPAAEVQDITTISQPVGDAADSNMMLDRAETDDHEMDERAPTMPSASAVSGEIPVAAGACGTSTDAFTQNAAAVQAEAGTTTDQRAAELELRAAPHEQQARASCEEEGAPQKEPSSEQEHMEIIEQQVSPSSQICHALGVHPGHIHCLALG